MLRIWKKHLQLFILHCVVEDPVVRGEKGLSESALHLSLREELPSLDSGISLGPRVASSPSVWPPPRRGFLSPWLGEGRGGSLRPSHSEQLLTSCQLHQSHAGEMATERRRGFRTAPKSVNQAVLTRPHLQHHRAPTGNDFDVDVQDGTSPPPDGPVGSQ